MIKMGRYDYAFQNYDSTKHVRASLREKKISHKHTEKKRCVPFGRFKNQVGHRSDPGVMAGRYPEKAATEVLKLLDNLESNAEYKGMDLDRLKIINATSHKGVSIKRFIPRAQGRATPKNDTMTHMEVVAQEI